MLNSTCFKVSYSNFPKSFSHLMTASNPTIQMHGGPIPGERPDEIFKEKNNESVAHHRSVGRRISCAHIAGRRLDIGLRNEQFDRSNRFTNRVSVTCALFINMPTVFLLRTDLIY